MEHTPQTPALILQAATTAARDIPEPLDILILAAGLGTRMRSSVAKVLHKLDNRPLIAHVCGTAAALTPRRVYVVVGHQAAAVEEAVRAVLGERAAVTFITQAEQRGTGDAVMAARETVAGDATTTDGASTLLVLSGDVPLMRADTLAALVHQHRTHRGRGAACTLMSVRLDDPTGYGRIVRDEDNRFQRIIEQKDATAEERTINEINAGIYCFDVAKLFPALERVVPVNAQGEYYLTDAPGILRGDGEDVSVFLHGDAREVSGINTRVELADFERTMRLRTLRRLMLDSGVTIIDPAHTYVDASAQIGRDTVLHPNTHIEGRTVIGENCEILPGARIVNSVIGNEVTIKDHSIITDSEIADRCTIGPFAHLRMNARMEEAATIGNFVEMKKSRLGRKSKAMHLTYLGDADIGERTNIGAGTITCNYDGKNKHPTVIESDVKIGSDTMLVAPVRVGARSITAAGSVVTKDVAPDTLVAGVPAKEKKRLATESRVDAPSENATNTDATAEHDSLTQADETPTLVG